MGRPRERERERERETSEEGGGNREELGPPPMVDFGREAPMAGNWHHRDRSSEASLEVVTARRMIAAAMSSRPAKNHGNKWVMLRESTWLECVWFT